MKTVPTAPTAVNAVAVSERWVADAPAIPGLRFRGFRGEEDFPAMVRVLNGSKALDQLEHTDSLEDIRHAYSHLSNCDPYQDLLMVEIDGQLVGYNRVFWMKEEAGPYIYAHFGFLLPEWRGKGIGRTMVQAAERRAREIAAGHPQSISKYLQAEVDEHQTALESIVKDKGYIPKRYFYKMVRPLDEEISDRPLPPGLEVRPIPPEHYRTVWEAHNEAFRDHWGYYEPGEEEYEEWLGSRIFNPALWQVAWDGDQVAGMVLNFIDDVQNRKFNRRWGYTEEIGVRRPWRKQGLARALLLRSLQLLKAQGMTDAVLGVDAENPNGAFHLYQSVGFRIVSRMTLYQKLLEA